MNVLVDTLPRARRQARPKPDAVSIIDENDPSCWISPKGEVYFVKEHGGYHSACATMLGDKRGGGELEEKGWLHVSYSSIFTGWDPKRQRDILPTQAQLDAVFDMAIACEAQRESSFVARRYMDWVNAKRDLKENS